jgi:hypothetical protein
LLDRAPTNRSQKEANMSSIAPKAQHVPDVELQQLALERGPGSAEAYILLELREARSAGDEVSAYARNGHFTVGAAPVDSSRSDTFFGDLS